MKILFMGTPAFALPSLQALVEAGHELLGVYTQPDKPKNRGMKLQAPPVKVYALEQGIPVFQPEKLRDGTALAHIQSMAPTLIVVAAYGRILPRAILDVPTLGCINVHSSLLPKYRGAAPIHWAILNGERESGVTIMHMAEALDAGDIIAQGSTPIDPNETVGDLHDRLAQMGAALLLDTVRDFEQGVFRRIPQNETEVSLAPMLSRELSALDWTRPARKLHDQVRGLTPWPAATTILAGKNCKISKTSVLDEQSQARPGTVLRADKEGIRMACGENTVLLLEEVQAEGKRRMSAAEFANGNPML